MLLRSCINTHRSNEASGSQRTGDIIGQGPGGLPTRSQPCRETRGGTEPTGVDVNEIRRARLLQQFDQFQEKWMRD